MTTAVLSDVISNQIQSTTGTAAANNTNLISGECAFYRTISLQITGTFSATISVQFSNDNSTFVTTAYNAVSTTISSASAIVATGLYQIKTYGFRYYRVRTTAYVSGTATATALLTNIESSS